MRMRHGGLHVFARGFTVSMCRIRVSFRRVVIAFGQLRRRLKMVVRRSDVVGRCKMMMFARHVSFVVSHDDVF